MGLSQEYDIMSITIQLDLPDALLNEARNNGLLESASVGDLLVTELRRRKAATALETVLEGIRRQSGEAMSEEAITAGVKAARRERRACEAGR
jgi:predicted kinase